MEPGVNYQALLFGSMDCMDLACSVLDSLAL